MELASSIAMRAARLPPGERLSSVRDAVDALKAHYRISLGAQSDELCRSLRYADRVEREAVAFLEAVAAGLVLLPCAAFDSA